MEAVTVTVKRKDEAQLHDMQLPLDLPAVRLAESVALALDWRDADGRLGNFVLEVFPPGSEQGHFMRLNETLAEAGAWDGSWVVFHPSTAAPGVSEAQQPSVTASQPPAPADTPVVKGWRQVQ